MRDTRRVVDAGQHAVRVIDRILFGFAVVAGVALAFQAVAVAGDALARFLGRPMRWVHEISTYTLLGFSFLAAPYALRKGAHFRVTILVDRLRPQTQRRLESALYVLSIGFLLALTFYGTDVAYTTWQNDVQAPTLLRTPQYLPRATLPVGAFLLALACVAQLLDRPGQAVASERGEPGKGEGET